MMAFEQKHIPSIGRGSRIFKNTRFPERPGRAIEPNKLYSRCRIIVENLFVFRVFQKIFKCGPGSDTSEILLDDRSRRDFAACGRRSPIRLYRSANQALTVAQPFTRRPKDPVKRDSRQTPRLRRCHINNPKTE